MTTGFFELGTEDRLWSSGGVGRRGGLFFLFILAHHIRLFERAFRVADRVVGHPFIGEEIGSFNLAFRCHHSGEHIRVEFVAISVPEEFLAGVNKAIDITDTDTSPQMPEFLLVEIPSRVCLDVSLDMEFLIELLEEESLLEIPAGWLSDGIHVPAFSDNAVFDDAGVTDEGVHAVGDHRRGRVTVVDGRRRVLLRLVAGHIR